MERTLRRSRDTEDGLVLSAVEYATAVSVERAEESHQLAIWVLKSEDGDLDLLLII